MLKSNDSNTHIKDPLRYKTVHCINFRLTGKCPYGSKCQYAHGIDELRFNKTDNICKIVDTPDDFDDTTPSTTSILDLSNKLNPDDDNFLSLYRSPTINPSTEKSIELPTFFSIDNPIDQSIEIGRAHV